ncbi:hypothetical protein FYS93_24860 [Escherichia coli]|nr:hypothetical protein [Escherichia coli]EFA5288399.1 hypothetical protein [Escherichia coli]EFN8110787.1 hypothetical protein [Escherichia coli]
MHGFACVLNPSKPSPAPALLRPELANAPVLKATHQAGRRGGESIARQSIKLQKASGYILKYQGQIVKKDLLLSRSFLLLILHAKVIVE